MWMLWALAIMLAAHTGALDVLPPSPVVQSLPSQLSSVHYVESSPLLPPPKVIFRSFSVQNSSPASKKLPETSGGQCAPASKYFLSAMKLEEYLNDTVPTEIENLVKCEEVNIIGLLGEVIDMVESGDLMDLLDISSILQMGGGGLDGILGMDSKDDKSPKLPSVSKVGKTVDNLASTSTGGEKRLVTGLIDSAGLPDLSSSLNNVAGKAKSLKESAVDKVKEALPSETTEALNGVLKDLDLKSFLLGLNIESVETKDMTSTVTDDGIDIMATAIATIGGEGVAGPIITVMGFQVHLNVTLKVVISTNNTQCVNLDVEETDINASKVSLRILSTVTETAPVPASLPLDNIISKVFSVELQKKVDNSESCGIVLSDFNECKNCEYKKKKNSIGLFQFHIKSAKTHPQGLTILYCVEALFDKTAVPVSGGLLPPPPQGADVSIIMSSMMIKTVVEYNAKQSSVKSGNLEATNIRVSYNFQQDSNSVRVVYSTTIKQAGENFARGESVLIISVAGKISGGKMTVNIELSRSEHNVNPPEFKNIVKDLLLKVQTKFSTHLIESAKNWNVPPGISRYPVNSDVGVMPSDDLLASS